jgi:hypothetical protein
VFVQRRPQCCDCSWDLGYRLDLLYGTDAQKTQAIGNPQNALGRASGWDNDWDNGVYGWAIPQLYLELAYGDFTLIAGHFFSLVGYEAVVAPGNFFYSHSLALFNSEPFTHTGVLASYALGDCLDVFAGWTLGWNTGFDQFGNGNNFLGGISFAVDECTRLNYIVTSGNFGARGREAYSHSLVCDVRPSQNFQYILQNDVVAIGAGAPSGLFNDQIGINQYLLYHCNECFALGGRLEWWKTDGTSFNEFTLGANFKPHANLVVRPEIRYDWQGNLHRHGVVGDDQTTFGVDAILTY